MQIESVFKDFKVFGFGYGLQEKPLSTNLLLNKDKRKDILTLNHARVWCMEYVCLIFKNLNFSLSLLYRREKRRQDVVFYFN